MDHKTFRGYTLKGFSHKQQLGLLGIFLLACGVRFYGINFGLPNTLCRPDEEYLIMIALRFFSGDFNPHFFNYPTLYLYLLFGIYLCYFLIRIALGGTVAEFLTEIALSPTSFFLLARGFSAFLGALTTILVFLIVKRLFDNKTAVLSAFFMSVAYLHVRDSHFGTTDVAMTFFIMWATLSIITCYHTQKVRDYIIAGVLTGLATGTKYGGILLVFPTMLAYFMNHGEPLLKQIKAKQLWLYGLTAVISFVISSPFILFDVTTFLKDFLYELHHVTKAQGVIAMRGWWYHSRYTLLYGVGWGMFLTSFAGVVISAKQDLRRALVLYLFPALFFLIAGQGYTVYLRYMLPLLPFICIASATFVVYLQNTFVKALTRKNLLPILACIVAMPSLYNVMLFDCLISKTDNRVLVADWINRHIPAGSKIYRSGSLFGQVQLNFSIESLEEQYQEVLRKGGTGRLLQIKIDHVKKTEPQGGYRDWKYDEHEGIFAENFLPDYIILQKSPLTFRNDVPVQIMKLLQERYHLIQAFEVVNVTSPDHWYNQMDAFYVPFIGFKDIERPGPNLYIYQ